MNRRASRSRGSSPVHGGRERDRSRVTGALTPSPGGPRHQLAALARTTGPVVVAGDITAFAGAAVDPIERPA